MWTLVRSSCRTYAIQSTPRLRRSSRSSQGSFAIALTGYGEPTGANTTGVGGEYCGDIRLQPREAGETRLTVDAGEDMERELLWPFYDDVLARGVPSNHVVVLRSLEET